MKLLLDASTLIPLLLDYGERLLDITAKMQLYVIDLTFYEVGNSLWKLVSLAKTISLEDAVEILEVLDVLVKRGLIIAVSFNKLDPHRIIELAAAEKLTFYDTSYIVAAEKLNATLATEDRELREKAGKYVNTVNYEELRRVKGFGSECYF